MEVESTYSSRGYFRKWSTVSGEKGFAIFLLFYGLVVGKYALICVKIKKIQMVVHIFSVFTSYTELM